MIHLAYDDRFVEDIKAGRKTQTIRLWRKWYIPRPGDDLHHYVFEDPTTPFHTSKCKFTYEIRMSDEGVKLNGVAIPPNRILEIAQADGFDSVESFRDFFKKTYGFPFCCPNLIALRIRPDHEPPVEVHCRAAK